MARSRRKKKWNLKKLTSRTVVRGIRFVVPVIFCVGFVALLFGVSYAFAVQSDLFTLQTITVQNGQTLTGNEALMFTGLRKYQPILSIDLKRIERRLRARNPQYKDIRVKRILPSEIEVTLKRRDPIAQVDVGGLYLVDKEGVIVGGGLSRAMPDITIIYGGRLAHNELRIGHKIDRQVFGLAIRLLGKIDDMQLLGGGHQISHIDIADKRNYKVWINDAIEVRLSAHDMRTVDKQIRKLAHTLRGIELDKHKIRYIDLRFDDVVIGPR